VDAVPGGSDDFAHVGPDGIEAGTGKGAAVARAGDGNLAGFSLIVGAEDDFRGPVGIPQRPILRVGGLHHQFPRAPLHAAVAVLAKIVDGVGKTVPVKIPLPEGEIRTGLLDAVGAAQAAFTPVQYGALAGSGKAPGNSVYGDVILGRHNASAFTVVDQA
jgi:hypothetical protein